jgi:hypothetical protein
MTRPSKRREEINVELIPGVDKRPHQTAIGLTVSTERGGCIVQRSFQRNRRPIVEGMSQRGRRLYPLQSMFSQRQGAKQG